MIQAVFFRDNRDLIAGFKITGHAGFADPGKDIVCAAVSILATTTVNSLVDQLAKEPTYQVIDEQGFLECFLPGSLSEMEQVKAQAVLKTLEIGLNSIEQEYAQYIKIKQRRWT